MKTTYPFSLRILLFSSWSLLVQSLRAALVDCSLTRGFWLRTAVSRYLVPRTSSIKLKLFCHFINRGSHYYLRNRMSNRKTHSSQRQVWLIGPTRIYQVPYLRAMVRVALTGTCTSTVTWTLIGILTKWISQIPHAPLFLYWWSIIDQPIRIRIIRNDFYFLYRILLI